MEGEGLGSGRERKGILFLRSCELDVGTQKKRVSKVVSRSRSKPHAFGNGCSQ